MSKTPTPSYKRFKKSDVVPTAPKTEVSKTTTFVAPELTPGTMAPSQFSMTRQGTATNELSRQIILPSSDFDLDRFTGTATFKRENIQLSFIDRNDFSGLRGSTHRLLEALVMYFTEGGSKDKTVAIPLREYMELCGLKDIKETRKQVRADLLMLRKMSITFTDKTTGDDRNYYNVSLAQGHGIINSVITITWGDLFYELLKSYPFMPIHHLYFKLDLNRLPHSRPLLRKIHTHKRINAGRPNEDSLSVATLLEECQELPTYEAVMAGNRNLYDRIIKPFEKNLDALKEALTWEYFYSDGTPLKKEDRQALNYELFITLIVKFTWKDYPDQSSLIEAREKRRKREKGKK